jgi:hypothetical protein
MTKSQTWATRAITALIIVNLFFFARGCWRSIQPPQSFDDSIRKVLEDTLQLNSGRIPEKEDSL